MSRGDARIDRCLVTLEGEAAQAERVARDLFVRAREGGDVDTSIVAREVEAARRIRKAIAALKGGTP